MATAGRSSRMTATSPSHVLIQMLVDVVAKGGNLLLNIGPSAEAPASDRSAASPNSAAG